MWFEILPSFGIIVGLMSLPHIASYVANKLVLDNCFRRSMIDKGLRYQYLRDRRLFDDPYKIAGLENIPDE